MKERIRSTLANRDKRCIYDPKLNASAVLVPIFEKDGVNHILFTRRTNEVEHHKGQISFPGGKYEKTDSDLCQTALRECFEEIGLHPEAVEIVGELDEERTIVSQYVISPFVGFIPHPYPFNLNSWEVAELLEVPVSVFMDESNLRRDVVIEDGISHPAYFYHYGDEVIWGATARIVNRFFNLMYEDNQP
ncbi:MAG: CoA pyrophosphatase [Chloroflexota bacterium]|nr:CoA pyrophosphatase [Chloroflexota bacterium]